MLHGKELCSTHYISQKQIEAVIIADIRSMAELVVKDEQTARAAFLSKKEQQTSRQSKADIKKLNDSKHRLAELENLMQSVYAQKLQELPKNSNPIRMHNRCKLTIYQMLITKLTE